VAVALATELTSAQDPATLVDQPPTEVLARLGLTEKIAHVRRELEGTLPALGKELP